jgi:hypothetical protein
LIIGADGGCGVIVTNCVSEAVTPMKSIVFQVTVVVPTGNPPNGELLVVVYGGTPPVTVGVPRFTVVYVPVATVVISIGATIFNCNRVWVT